MSHAPENYYQMLGVPRHAAAQEIDEAFLAQRTDYLQRTADPAADPDYQRLLYAYEVLSDPQRRALYDSLLTETTRPMLQATLQLSRDRIPMLETSQIVYLLANVRPAEQSAAHHTLPLNLCLVVDRSTSMRGERLERVVAAVDLIFDKLAPGDVLSLVSFSDRAEVVLPAGHVTERQAAHEAIQAMEAAGGTEIYQGLASGVQQLRQFPLDGYTNHLILLTDGHTYGDADKCLRLAQEVAAENISFTAFGIGAEWNDQFLDALVAPTNGQSGYIERPSQIIDYLQERVKGLGAVYARNVRLQQQWPTRVTVRDGFKLAPFAQPLALDGGDLQLGSIEGRSPLTFLLELSIEPQPIPTRIKIPLTFTVDVPGQGEQRLQEKVQLLVAKQAPQREPPPELVKAVRLLNLYRLNEKAWQEVAEGQLQQAATRMRHLTTRYLEVGEASLAQQANAEAQRLTRLGTASVEGRKRMKYGTRMLLGQSTRLEDSDSV